MPSAADEVRDLLEVIFPGLSEAELHDRWRSGAWFVGPTDWTMEATGTPELDSLDTALQLGCTRLSVMSQNDNRDLDTRHGVSPAEARRAYADGYTIQILDPVASNLGRLAARAAAEVGCPMGSVHVRVVYSPPGARVAYGWHFDGFDNIHIPLRGSKHWQLVRCPDLAFPLSGGHADADPDASRDLYLRYPHYGLFDYFGAGGFDLTVFERADTVNMTPGQALFLPRGTWHRTQDIGPEGSIALIFEFRPVPWYHVAELALFAELLPRPSWRESALGLLAPRRDELALEQEAQRILDELREILERLDGRSFLAAYRAALAGNLEPGERQLQLDRATSVELRCRPDAKPVLHVERDHERTELSFSSPLSPVCDWILRSGGQPFTISTVLAATASLALKHEIPPTDFLNATLKFIACLERIGVLRPP